MRIIFFGSPIEAAGALESLVAAGHEVAAVYSQPDRKAGRGRTKTPTPVKSYAAEQGLPVFLQCYCGTPNMILIPMALQKYLDEHRLHEEQLQFE